jgi:hypothetical protein
MPLLVFESLYLKSLPRWKMVSSVVPPALPTVWMAKSVPSVSQLTEIRVPPNGVSFTRTTSSITRSAVPLAPGWRPKIATVTDVSEPGTETHDARVPVLQLSLVHWPGPDCATMTVSGARLPACFRSAVLMTWLPLMADIVNVWR